jgi:hypothetical protein
MADVSGFVAYPSHPPFLEGIIEHAVKDLKQRTAHVSFDTWRASDIVGQFIGSQITDDIAAREILVADITRLNFNVTYEIGFAIGRQKRILLIINAPTKVDDDSAELGIFDTIGHKLYENSHGLVELLQFANAISPIQVGVTALNPGAPVYLCDAKFKTDQITRILSRVKKAKLKFRSFDPNEQPRLSAMEAIRQVSQSYGVLLHLLPNDLKDSRLHNLRVAFLAGLADGMGKVRSILQFGYDPVPMDFRDFVRPCLHPDQIDQAISDFATDVSEAFQTKTAVIPEPSTFLAKMDLGASAAENELRDLASYYIETDEYKRSMRGEARMIVGRKGSGKSAIFFQVRDKLRQDRKNVVLDLKPDGYQLLKFKESVLRLMAEGTYEHTITAFWEYLLLLEICHKLLENDRLLHTRDRRLYDVYRKLDDSYSSDDYVSEGDFSERMSAIIRNISNNFDAEYGQNVKIELSNAQVTELLYMHDMSRLREDLDAYLQVKRAVWILFDNLDKGWPARGIQRDDLVLLKCLEEATRKLSRQFERHHIDTYAMIFLRQDVYELLVEATPDRGKDARVSLDWTDAELLREMLRRRFAFSGAPLNASFSEVWRTICVSHVKGEESSQFLIDRCLMRPRFLINLFGYCRGYAVNLGHQKIEPEDIDKGLKAHSDDLVRDIGQEIRILGFR